MSVLSLARPASAPVAVRRHARAAAGHRTRMTRYRGGTYSHTVDTVVFSDGTSARTDLIRLNPDVAAYSLDFTGHAPTRPSHYRVADWSAVPQLRSRAYEAEVAWILRNSYPALTTAELSARLRAAGYPLGPANIAEHEAIAATQAAIWTFTNDLHLDTRPRSLPISQRRTADGIVFEFADELELGGYTIDIASGSALTLVLQKSADGVTWRDVPASGLNVDAGRGTYRRSLGVGSTVARTRHGRRGHGHRFYRLTILADADVAVRDVRFSLSGTSEYRNADRVVHLYNYLLDGALRARHTPSVDLVADDATAADGLVGPFRLTETARLTAATGEIVDADGVAFTGPVPAGAEFYVRPRAGADGVVLTATLPGGATTGRVVTGVADANHRLTPVALAHPAPLEVDFAIYVS
jgi:TQXA domain-containing protein